MAASSSPEKSTPLVPVQPNAAGTCLSKDPPPLFKPLKIRSVTFHNRVWVSPMCQYSCACQKTPTSLPGRFTSHHHTHYTSFILRGPGLTIIEATSVTPNGRISPYDCGLWTDEQIAPIAEVVAFAKERGQKVGIQLAHAGRKASTRPPWRMSRGLQSAVAEHDEGGWPDDVVGPSAERWGDGYPDPREMSIQDIADTLEAYKSATKRALQAGVEVIEIHAAHGYLLGSFLSRVSNHRSDHYGGPALANRMRFLLEVIDTVRSMIPAGMPLLARISSTEWLENDDEAWNDNETVQLAIEIHRRGVDVLTLSSGGNSQHQRVPRTTEYQTDIARRIRKKVRAAGCDILIGAVGRISQPKQANDLLSGDEPAGDVCLVGRQFLKEPGFVLRAAQELGLKVQWPTQYQLGRYGLENKL